MIFVVVRVLHLFFMALWLSTIVKEIASPLCVAGEVGMDKSRLLKRRRTSMVLVSVSGVGTIVSGSFLISILGAAGVSWTIHAGFTIAIIMLLISLIGVAKQFKKLIALVEQGEADAEIQSAGGRLKLMHYVLLAMWTLAFIFMGFRHFL